MYRISIKTSKFKKRKKVLYFKNWGSACDFCALAGLRMKEIKVAKAGKMQ